MKKIAVLVLFVGLVFRQAVASAILTMMAIKFAVEFGAPCAVLLGYGMCNTPSIHIFGTEEATYGLDWGSLRAHSRNVYGMQLSLIGGGFSEDLYGLQCGILASGWVEDYDLSQSRMNGIQFAPFAAKAAMANGFQVCPIFSWADTVNGFQISCCCSDAEMVNGLQFGGCFDRAKMVNGIQCGLVNLADRVNGLQVGLYNSTVNGHCLQIGLANCVGSHRSCPFFPIVNGCFR